MNTTMNKFISLLLVVMAIAQATAFMGTPLVTQRQVRIVSRAPYEPCRFIALARIDNNWFYRFMFYWRNALHRCAHQTLTQFFSFRFDYLACFGPFVSITGCRTTQWCFFHGNESTSLRFARKGSQPQSPCCYLLAQAYQEGPTCQPPIQEILLREPRPQGQASTFHKGNQDGKQIGRNRCRRQKVQRKLEKVLKCLTKS